MKKGIKSACHSEGVKTTEESSRFHKDPSRMLRMTGERGRSMVEMLGVLAIVGVLSVGGFAALKIALNKAKANNLVSDMNRLAHIVVMDKFSGYSEEAIQRAVNEHNQSTEYQAEYEYRTPRVFALKTKNAIDKKMCQQVASLGWKLPLAT